MTTPNLAEGEQRILTVKKDALLKSLTSVDMVAVGSSHGDYSFNPEIINGSYNFCTASQDLYCSRHLYHWLAQQKNLISDVVLFYSIFSPAFNLSVSREKMRCAGWKAVFGIEPLNTDSEVEDAFQALDKTACYSHNVLNYLGFNKTNRRHFLPDRVTVEGRVAGHHRLSEAVNPECRMHEHLSALADATKANNHRLTVVIAPARSDYRNQLPPYPYFSAVEKIASEKEFRILNLFADPEFTDDLFGDFDHLKPCPAADQVTARIASFLGR